MSNDRYYGKKSIGGESHFADGGSIMDKLSMKIGDAADAVTKPFRKPEGYTSALDDAKAAAPAPAPAPAKSGTQLGGMNLAVNARREKEAGLADGGSVSFWERLKAGNIDDPNSEAYRRWNPKAAADYAQSDEKFNRPAPAPAPSADSSDDGTAAVDAASPKVAYDADLPTEADVKAASPAPAPVRKSKPKAKAKPAPSPAPSPAPAPASAGADAIPTGGDGTVKADDSALTLGVPTRPGDYDRGAKIASDDIKSKSAAGPKPGGMFAADKARDAQIEQNLKTRQFAGNGASGKYADGGVVNGRHSGNGYGKK